VGVATLNPEERGGARAAPLNYFFSQHGLFVIPVEAWSEQGLDGDFRQAIIDRQALSEDGLKLLEAAWALYWKRTAGLNKSAPEYWFPPRVQHLCLVSRPAELRPYFQPFNRSSWLLYVSDFEPETSNVEFAAYQIVHAERMMLLRQIAPVLYHNLSYFLLLNERQLESFCEGCLLTPRPDAAGFRALARLLPKLRQCGHESLRAREDNLDRVSRCPDTGLIVPHRLRPVLAELQHTWTESAQAVIERYRAFHTRKTPGGGEVVEWLHNHQPPLLVTGAGQNVLWKPGSDSGPVQTALSGASKSGAERILRDLAVVEDRSGRFLNSLTAREELAQPATFMTPGGLSYIHRDLRLIAYDIGPGRNESRLWEASPPYERWMLAARTAHEWGHLAAESGWVRIPPQRAEEHRRHLARLADLFERIHHQAPSQIKDRLAGETARLEATAGSVSRALLEAMQLRIEDYMANLVARKFLSADEMDTYVRNNVYSHRPDFKAGKVYLQLIRLAYEFQYLGLARIDDPMDWFLKSTGFTDQFISSGLIRAGDFETLTDTVAAICGCFEIDHSKFDFSRSEQYRSSASGH
jgi:hypothetical protein